jgi:hypothetical protein
MAWDEPLFLAMQFKITNKINGFKPVSYGMALNFFPKSATSGKAGGLTEVERLEAAGPFGRQPTR